jgi:drug/metabolite transporter (DMT)-like permease
MLNRMLTRIKRMGTVATGMMMAVFVALWPAIAWAQAKAPEPPVLRKSPPVWLGFLVMALLLVMVLAVSLMPSKRTHQD